MSITHPLKITEIRSRIDPDLKENATRILAACGLNVSDAVRLFLHQVVTHNGLPFEVKAPNPVTLAAMEEADSGKLPTFSTIQDLFNDLEIDSAE